MKENRSSVHDPLRFDLVTYNFIIMQVYKYLD